MNNINVLLLLVILYSKKNINKNQTIFTRRKVSKEGFIFRKGLRKKPYTQEVNLGFVIERFANSFATPIYCSVSAKSTFVEKILKRVRTITKDKNNTLVSVFLFILSA